MRASARVSNASIHHLLGHPSPRARHPAPRPSLRRPRRSDSHPCASELRCRRRHRARAAWQGLPSHQRPHGHPHAALEQLREPVDPVAWRAERQLAALRAPPYAARDEERRTWGGRYFIWRPGWTVNEIPSTPWPLLVVRSASRTAKIDPSGCRQGLDWSPSSSRCAGPSFPSSSERPGAAREGGGLAAQPRPRRRPLFFLTSRGRRAED